MHVEHSVTANEFLKFVADEAPTGFYFVAQPPPGIVMTAAIDWRVVVPDSAAIDALATALWSGYECIVKPLQNDSKGRSPLGRDVDKKDGFVHRVRESAAILSPKNKELALDRELELTTGSEYWQKVC